MSETNLKMFAKNYFPDIIGINLEYALDAYDWEGWHPMTDDGVTVTGFWDKRKGMRRDDRSQRAEWSFSIIFTKKHHGFK